MARSPQKHLRAMRVLETFLGEAAVLLAVFPILDEFIQRGRVGVTWKVVVLSTVGAAVLLSGAIVLAVFFDEEDA